MLLWLFCNNIITYTKMNTPPRLQAYSNVQNKVLVWFGVFNEEADPTMVFMTGAPPVSGKVLRPSK